MAAPNNRISCKYSGRFSRPQTPAAMEVSSYSWHGSFLSDYWSQIIRKMTVCSTKRITYMKNTYFLQRQKNWFQDDRKISHVRPSKPPKTVSTVVFRSCPPRRTVIRGNEYRHFIVVLNRTTKRNNKKLLMPSSGLLSKSEWVRGQISLTHAILHSRFQLNCSWEIIFQGHKSFFSKYIGSKNLPENITWAHFVQFMPNKTYLLPYGIIIACLKIIWVPHPELFSQFPPLLDLLVSSMHFSVLDSIPAALTRNLVEGKAVSCFLKPKPLARSFIAVFVW